MVTRLRQTIYEALIDNVTSRTHERVPAGDFKASDFYVQRDNHNGGLHCHPHRTKDKKRTDIRLCYDLSAVCVENHGAVIQVPLQESYRYVGAHLVGDVVKQLSRFSQDNLTRPTSKALRIPLA